MYGTQAYGTGQIVTVKFENDVKMYGTQAGKPGQTRNRPFENDVKMYGTQAILFFVGYNVRV